MLNHLIQWSLRHRAVVLALALVVLGLGLRTGLRLPVEVLPDLTKPTVVILTEAPGLAPEEVETRVTQPLESSLLGVAGLTRLRSNSDVSLSLIYVEFDWDTDIQRARTLVQERLQVAREQLPEDVQPFMTPVASLMGEILLVGVRSTTPAGEPGHLSPPEVRTLADWTVRPRLQSIPGIAEILNMGGGIRRVEVRPDPARMAAYSVTHDEIAAAAAAAAGTTTGGFIDSGPTEIMVRNLAMSTDLAALGRTVVRAGDDRVVTLADVAEVAWGVEPMRGDASVSVVPEREPTRGVVMSITKAPGFDTRSLTEQVEAALAELRPALPAGVEIVPLFQQRAFIDHAIGNLGEAIRDAAIMVSLVLFLFLLNVRTTVITLTAIPLSFAITLLTFDWFGLSVNSMTLGGLAVAMGMVVDDAIVDVENVFRRLRENAALAAPRPRLRVIAEASGEVRNSILYATVLIVLVFLPLLGLSGVEGKLFAPIAIATILSMAASFLVSLTVIPVLCALLLKPRAGAGHDDGRIVRGIKKLVHATAIRPSLAAPAPVLLAVALLLAGAFALYPMMGKDFLPRFREETILVAATASPGTSLPEMNRIADILERELLAVDGVAKVGRRLGRAERGDHVVPVSTAEFDVDFVPDSPRPRAEIVAEINERLRRVPGAFAAISGPLADRIGHMLSGVSAPVAVKIFGPDLGELRRLGEQVQGIARAIPGFEKARLDAQADIPQLRIEPDRERAAAYGVTPGALNEQLSALVGGEEISELREGRRTVPLVMRLPEAWRDSPERLRELPIETPSGVRVPLRAVADVREALGPNVIFRENSQRRLTLAIQPTGRDVGTSVEQLRAEVAEKVKFPEGYFVTYEGEFEARRDATRRIALLGAVIAVAIIVLLHAYFRSLGLAFQVMLSIPLALAGALAFTWWKLDNISIATLVGFIAVGGVAARNNIMLLSHYLHLMQHEGEGFTREMIVRGTLERVVPVLMTALAAGIALIPLVLAADQPGKEILHPVAVAIVGGLASCTVLTFVVTPTVFWLTGRRASERALAGHGDAFE
jgi:CzcA family heavy metal efflux pump